MRLSRHQFGCRADAENSLSKLSDSLKYHKILSPHVSINKMYDSKGRPGSNSTPKSINYQITGNLVSLLDVRKQELLFKSCYTIGSNIPNEELSSERIIEKYKNQNSSIERGFRFLKDPLFFVSSFYLKKESRIMSLLFIMVLSLLIYSVLQMHLRATLKTLDETLPNQINQPTKKPTMRWVFHLFEGVDIVYVKFENCIKK